MFVRGLPLASEVQEAEVLRAAGPPLLGQETQSAPSAPLAFALSCVLVSVFKLSLTQYVDDFPQVEPCASAESALVCEAVLALLGWESQAGRRQDTSFRAKLCGIGGGVRHACVRARLGRFESLTADLP